MKTRIKFFAIVTFFIFSCKHANNRSSHVAADATESGIIIAKPVVTVLADLPDSLQPKTVFLKDRPKPKVVDVSSVPANKSSTGDLNSGSNNSENFILGDGVSYFTQYTTKDGLALDAVFTSFQDSQGNIWFGTDDGGVSRFDGKHFTHFSQEDGMASRQIRNIAEDKHGNIWFNCGIAISGFNGRRFVTIKVPGKLPGKIVLTMTIDQKGLLWLGTYGNGIYEVVPSVNDNNPDSSGQIVAHYTKEQGLVSNLIECIYQDHNGDMWVGTDSGVSRLDGQHFVNFSEKNGFKGKYVSSILEDHKGRYWFGCGRGGLIESNNGREVDFTKNDGYPDESVSSLMEDDKGTVWSANSRGITRYDGKNFVTYTPSQGLAGGKVTGIMQDRGGHIWITTYGGGVDRFDGNAFKSFELGQRSSSFYFSTITADNNGNLFLGSRGGGIWKFNGKTFANITGDNSNAWASLKDSSGNIWFGTASRGLVNFDGKHFTTYTQKQGLVSGSIDGISSGKNGDLWVITINGLSRFDGKSFTTYNAKQGVPNFNGYMLCDHNGHVWMGNADGTISYFDGHKIVKLSLPETSDYIADICEDRSGNMWFGTQDGLVFLSRDEIKKITNQNVNNRQIHFRKFTKADGLSDNGIIQIAQLKDGKMAAGTTYGVTIFDKPGHSANSYRTLRNVEIFNVSTGCPIEDFSTGEHTLYQDKAGIIWAAQESEQRLLVRFDYDALFRNKEMPKVSIEQAKINDKVMPWNLLLSSKNDTTSASEISNDVVEELQLFNKILSRKEADSIRAKYRDVHFDSVSTGYIVPQNLTLPYQFNKITLDFGTHELAHPNLIVYQYKLEGYDKDWSPVTKNTSATYGNMHEGTYTFKVKARYTGLTEGNAGNWTEPISYTFKVLPPWYRTWFAYVLYFLTTASVIYLFIKWRTKSLQHDKEVLENKVTERTTELKQSLEELKSTQSQLIQQEKMASLGELTAGIAHEIQNPLNFVNNFSEVNQEMIDELKNELATGNLQLANEIADDIKINEEKISHHGKRADAIVKSMLQHSRTSSGQKEPTDINALCDEYLRLSYHGMRAKDKSFEADFKTDFDPSIGKIDIVAQDIGRVLLNLYNNAFYACAERSNAVKEQKSDNLNSYEPTVSVTSKKSGNRAIISVSDNGGGIHDNIKEKIFQPFFTTKPTGSGTGLGLSLSYDIVKAHGGEIRVQSREREGTTFIIQLPITQ